MKFERIKPKELKRRLRARKISGLAIDIDDTLSHTGQHWFERMSLRFGNPENITCAEIIKKYGRIKNVPYWQSPRAKRFIKKLIRSNEFQARISLIKGSNNAIQKIHRIVPVAAYVTGRPVSVYKSTRQWLARHNFPNAPIILLPFNVSHEKRNLWKAKQLKFLYPEVRGIIDDHPHLKKELKAIGYRGMLFMYDSGRNARRYHHRAVRFHSWPDILREISKLTG